MADDYQPANAGLMYSSHSRIVETDGVAGARWTVKPWALRMAFSFRDLVDQFLTSRRAFEYETEDFIPMKHDQDLVKKTDSQLARIAEAYGYFTALSFETQGINDNGADVSVRIRDLSSEEDGPHRVLGFQIKSHSELVSPDVVSKMKAQRDDAFRKIPELSHYYILLCAYERQLKKRLNAIRAEFLNAERTTVVSPGQALRFLRYEPFQIDAQVKRMMDQSDIVLRELRRSLDISSDTAKALVCYLAAHLISEGTPSAMVSEMRDGVVGRLYDRVIAAAREQQRRREEARATGEIFNLGDDIEEPEDDDESTLGISSLDPDDAFAFDIEQLEGDLAEQSQDGNTLTLMISAAAPVIAVAADAMVRYGYTREEVVPYLLDLAGVEL